MLPKQQRLTSVEVRKVLKEGRALRQGGVSARYTKTGPAATGKLSVVVSTKVAKSAALRNRLRRAGYQALPRAPRGRHTVIFIQRKDFTPEDITTLCSKLT